MTFDPFLSSSVAGDQKKKQAFLVGNGEGRVHFLAKMALYRGQSINCYHLITKKHTKLEGRKERNFPSIRDEFIAKGVEVAHPSDIPFTDVDAWVKFGLEEAKKRGLQVRE
jgi:hypothetical protein